MAFLQRELSPNSGQPVYLYDFNHQGVHFCFTNADRDMTQGGEVYVATAMNDDGYSQTGNDDQDNTTIEMPVGNYVVQTFLSGTPPEDIVYITIREIHWGDTQAVVIWQGYVKSVTQKDLATADVICSTLTTLLQTEGLREVWQRSCPHCLYDSECTVSPANYAVAGTITGLNGITFNAAQVSGYANNYFSGGYFEWTDSYGILNRRAIEQQTGVAITILGGNDKLSNGMAITLYPGCDLTTYTCVTKFNNLLNFGGVPMMVTKSPFSGDPVY